MFRISTLRQARRNEIHIGGAETRRERSELKRGSGGLPPGKFFMTTPFRSLENAPFSENLLLTEAKNHHWWGFFQENFSKKSPISQGCILFLSCKASKVIALLIDYDSFLEYIWIWIFTSTTLAFTAFFTYEINKLQQIIGGLKPPPAPPLPTGLPGDRRIVLKRTVE